LLVLDKLSSYAAAFRQLRLMSHEQSSGKNYCSENSHQVVRRRERKIQRPKSARSAQPFLSVPAAVHVRPEHAAVHNTFNRQFLTSSNIPINTPYLPSRRGEPMAERGRGGVTPTSCIGFAMLDTS
jgi:hypothetical protein